MSGSEPISVSGKVLARLRLRRLQLQYNPCTTPSARRNLYANFMRISTHAKTTHTNNEYKKKKIKKQAQKKRGQKQLNKTRHQNQKRATVRRARQLDTHHPLFYRTGTISKVTWTTSDWIEIYRKGGYAVLVNLVVKKVLIFGYQYNFLNNFLLRFYNFAMNYHYYHCLTAINENNPIIIRG